MKQYLDFGAGFTAQHTLRLRQAGFSVVAHDFGRNFVPGLHDPDALSRKYPVVFASNVINVQISLHSLHLALAQMARALEPAGVCLLNYPQEPRKMGLATSDMVHYLGRYFKGIEGVKGRSGVWLCRVPDYQAAEHCLSIYPGYSAEEMAGANIRPSGAVGARAIVPRLILEGAVLF